MSIALPLIIVVVAALIAFGVGAWLARRTGHREKRGDVIVRCGRGHLFTTVWNAPFSVRRLDLGWGRLQRCPVGNHLSLVRVVDDSILSAEERKLAKKQRDGVKSS